MPSPTKKQPTNAKKPKSLFPPTAFFTHFYGPETRDITDAKVEEVKSPEAVSTPAQAKLDQSPDPDSDNSDNTPYRWWGFRSTSS